MNLPEIRIKYGRLLDSNVVHELNYPIENEIELKVEAFSNEWKKYEQQILTAITEKLQLSFKQNVIDVHIVGVARPISNPLVIGSQVDVNEFVDILTHELLHRLLADDDKETAKRIGKEWDETFILEHNETVNHVLIHAVSKYIYLEVLKEPFRLKRDQLACQKRQWYEKSWEIVEDEGYNEIIERFIALKNKQ